MGEPLPKACWMTSKSLQEAGITHPDMEKIKALLTTETEA
jgi:hypothetical protein